MDAISIISRAVVVVANFVFGGCFALFVMTVSLLMPLIAMGGDAGNATFVEILGRVAIFVLLLGYCGAWFLYTNRVLADRANAYVLPMFWGPPALAGLWVFGR